MAISIRVSRMRVQHQVADVGDQHAQAAEEAPVERRRGRSAVRRCRVRPRPAPPRRWPLPRRPPRWPGRPLGHHLARSSSAPPCAGPRGCGANGRSGRAGRSDRCPVGCTARGSRPGPVGGRLAGAVRSRVVELPVVAVQFRQGIVDGGVRTRPRPDVPRHGARIAVIGHRLSPEPPPGPRMACGRDEIFVAGRYSLIHQDTYGQVGIDLDALGPRRVQDLTDQVGRHSVAAGAPARCRCARCSTCPATAGSPAPPPRGRRSSTRNRPWAFEVHDLRGSASARRPEARGWPDPGWL